MELKACPSIDDVAVEGVMHIVAEATAVGGGSHACGFFDLGRQKLDRYKGLAASTT